MPNDQKNYIQNFYYSRRNHHPGDDPAARNRQDGIRLTIARN